MRMMLSLALVSLATACATAPADDPAVDLENGTVTGDLRINTSTDLTEPAFVNGANCKMVFPGALTPSTQMYQIWPVGTKGIVAGAAYNTPERPNLYAVFGTAIPASAVHHVDGFNQFDHYHVLDNAEGTEVDNRKWDLLTLWPGPNYDAATYTVATSVKELMAQSAAGILSPVLTLPEVGFPEVVLNFPVTCR